MAITRAQVVAAVEKYLPRTMNYARSPDLGDRDVDAEFSRLHQIVLTGLIVDPDAVYYLIYLAARRLLARVETALATVATLQSTSELKAVTGNSPSRMSDLAGLQDAQTSLVRLSSGVADAGTFPDAALVDFRAGISSFLSGQVAPAAAPSALKVDGAIRARMEALKTEWADVLTRRGTVFSLLGVYTDSDLRVQVAQSVAQSVNKTLRDLSFTLPTQTTEEQVSEAEATLVDLAAAEAALTLVGSLSSPLGSVVVPPASDGSTPSSYLLVEGKGRTERLLPLLRGTDGKLRLTGPVAGAPFTSITGLMTAPGAGTTTDRMTDTMGVDFVAQGVAPGMYLTFVDLGVSVEILTASTSLITFSPDVFYDSAPAHRYAVTDHPPGEFFQSPGTDFWRDLVSSSTASTLLTSATADGAFVRVDKLSGSDLTNALQSGVAGSLRPPKLSGVNSTQIATFSLFTSDPADPGLLSGLVDTADSLYVTGLNDPGNPYGIVSVDSEHTLTISGAWAFVGGGSWYVEAPTASITLEDVGASFLVSTVQVGDTLRVLGAQAGDFPITSLESQGELQASTAAFTPETGASWEVLSSLNNIVLSASESFSTVSVGDKLVISGTAADDGEYDISVVGTGYLRLQQTLSGQSFSGATFSVHEAIYSKVSDTFRKAGGASFVSLPVDKTVLVSEILDDAPTQVEAETVLRVDTLDYLVQSRVDADTLIIRTAEGVGDFTTTTTFSDANATWVTDGVDPTRHDLVVTSGTARTAYAIASVDSETQLTLIDPGIISSDNVYAVFPKIVSAVDWEVYAGLTTRNFFDTTGLLPFVASERGKTIAFLPGTSQEQRFTINSIVSTSEVWLSGYLPQGLSGKPYALLDIVGPGLVLHATGGGYPIVGVVDAHTLQLDSALSVAPGIGLPWSVSGSGVSVRTFYVYDPVGAAALDPVAGFTDALRGNRVDIMADRPIKGTYVKAYDPGADGFGEAFRVDASMPLGFGDMAYRILGAPDNQSNIFDALSPPQTPASGDLLTVWGVAGARTISAVSGVSPTSLTVSPFLPARLSDQAYVVVRGGGVSHGSYLLAESFNGKLAMDADTSVLRLKVAELLLDHGLVETSITLGTSGSVSDSGADGSSVLEDSLADMSSVLIGDRVTLGSTLTFVDQVLSPTSVLLSPGVTAGSPVQWSISRNSVSSSLQEARRLQTQLEELQGILTKYTVGRSETVEQSLKLLREQGLDRAVDLLYDGDLSGFLSMTATDGSYAMRARASIQRAGSDVTAGQDLADRVVGVDPETGRRAPIGNRGASRYSTAQPAESVESIVGMSQGVSDLRAEELTQSMLTVTEEEQRNRAIYQLTGEIMSGFIGDEDPTLPWIAETGSVKEQIAWRLEDVRSALQYMVDHPDEFDEVEVVDSLDAAVASALETP